MILEFNGYKIVTDDKQFIVQKKKVVQAGRLTKEENIGKEYWEDVGYFTNLNFALKFIKKTILLDNDDLKVIMDRLNQLEGKIDEFTQKLGE
ncbi:hypothetical protein IRP63_14385 (plasmid) [Clostridium botulinum]|uniref:Uncharacterized protein n=1 Tax=Clostridium botulinum C/D str. DC5 TaxID=1443128 RepID=A0A0A0HVX1_CLOBO|nr:hypothetical protein [Clostridium botulinum]KGM93299.1 hypothetical protein Z955_15060 [Clostridium botulinum C/D str. DC5]KOC45522.1 hypothetical protein ADU88_13635 [Clostridium botulinum]KOC56831.1 hypothetical protein ADU89_01090 [Clostridium botulinum]KOC57306.1 hypothetical protein ADU90_05630 [Clostridium botulinum]MCD3232528.1 hypothetical protein [Clostridium botulinum D/C]